MKSIFISVLTLMLLSCSESSKNVEPQENSDIGIKNSTEVDSLALKLKEIEVMIESNDEVIKNLKE